MLELIWWRKAHSSKGGAMSLSANYFRSIHLLLLHTEDVTFTDSLHPCNNHRRGTRPRVTEIVTLDYLLAPPNILRLFRQPHGPPGYPPYYTTYSV